MIDVLLATYMPNQKYLKEQIGSIRAQKDVHVNIISREDVANNGVCANFSALLETSTAEYVAFSDQDDVWMEDKLARTLMKMREMESMYGAEAPLLVFTDAKVVDENLRLLDHSLFYRTKIDPNRLSPQSLILQNVANGNTMLFNAALREKVKQIPKEAFMHDHWVALVASVFGKTTCINEPTLYYRQHIGNVLGGCKVGLFYYFHKFFFDFSSTKKRFKAYIRQAEEFARRYPDAPDCFKACVGFEQKNWFERRRLLVKYGIFKRGFLRNLGIFMIA